MMVFFFLLGVSIMVVLNPEPVLHVFGMVWIVMVACKMVKSLDGWH
jgi:hypothetical protein